jgi:hypothetical protein
MVYFKEPLLISPVYGSVNQEHISMPDTSDKEYPEPFQIMPGCKAVEYLYITIIAGCSTEVKYPERLFETIILKTHYYNYLITKCDQYQCNNGKQVHPYQEETHCLSDLYSGTCVSYKGNKKHHPNNF